MTLSTPQPSIDWEGVEQTLVDWVADVTGLEAIWAEEGGTQPDRPYAVLDWLQPPSAVGDDYFNATENTATHELERELQGVREATLTVRVDSASTRAGESAMYFCDLLANSLSDDNVVLTRFKPLRMAPWDWEAVRKLPFVEEGKAVSRAAFDVKLGFSAGTGGIAQRVGYITKVSLTGSVTNETQTQSLTAAVTS